MKKLKTLTILVVALLVPLALHAQEGFVPPDGVELLSRSQIEELFSGNRIVYSDPGEIKEEYGSLQGDGTGEGVTIADNGKEWPFTWWAVADEDGRGILHVKYGYQSAPQYYVGVRFDGELLFFKRFENDHAELRGIGMSDHVPSFAVAD